MSVAGIVLAAGEGRRYGRPKALVDDWLPRSVDALLQGGCFPVTVVLGAAAAESATHVPERAAIVQATRWSDGLGASLRAALDHLDDTAAAAAVVHLVDLPDVGPEVIARLLAVEPGPHSLARAVYRGRPGHPVLLGRDHWQPIRALAHGNSGARDYLRRHPWTPVECGDLATGRDVDVPPSAT